MCIFMSTSIERNQIKNNISILLFYKLILSCLLSFIKKKTLHKNQCTSAKKFSTERRNAVIGQFAETTIQLEMTGVPPKIFYVIMLMAILLWSHAVSLNSMYCKILTSYSSNDNEKNRDLVLVSVIMSEDISWYQSLSNK